MADVLGFLLGQIDSGIPGAALNAGGHLYNLFDLLVSRYGSWEAVPQELKDLFGGGGFQSGSESYGWLVRMYANLMGTNPTQGTPPPVRDAGGSGSGSAGEPEPFRGGSHDGSAAEQVAVRAGVDGGSGNGSGEEPLRYIDGMLVPDYIRASGYNDLLEQRRRVRKIVYDNDVAWVIRKNHWDILNELNAKITEIENKLATPTTNREPYKDYDLEGKLAEVLRRAIASGRFSEGVRRQLEQMADPAHLTALVGTFAAYGALHGTPAAPFLAVVDTFFLVSGGTELALGMQRIYNAVNGATTEEEMDAAAGVLAEELSGPAADAILNTLLWGAGKAAGKLASKLKPDPNSINSLPGNIGWRYGEGPEIDAINPTTPYRGGFARPPKHHVFPQAERTFFEERGVDIDDFARTLDEATHQAIHGGGNPNLGRMWNGEWNNQIMKRILDRERDLGRTLTPQEIGNVGSQMMKDYGIEGNFVPYP